MIGLKFPAMTRALLTCVQSVIYTKGIKLFVNMRKDELVFVIYPNVKRIDRLIKMEPRGEENRYRLKRNKMTIHYDGYVTYIISASCF